jgi:hypothetical protein
MKNSLLYILVFSVAFLSGCKKDDEPLPPPNDSIPVVQDSFDPFTDVQNFEAVQNILIEVDSLGRFVGYSVVGGGSRTIQYIGDSIAKINTNLPTQYSSYEYYYLNSQGYADSAITTYIYFDPSYTNTSKQYFEYYPDGFLKNIWSPQGLSILGELAYVNNNYAEGDKYEYYDDIAKLDLFSKHRSYNGLITGKDDANLLKKIRYQNFDQYYFYQLNSDGYVTSCILMSDLYNQGDSTFIKKDFTYHFIQ